MFVLFSFLNMHFRVSMALSFAEMVLCYFLFNSAVFAYKVCYIVGNVLQSSNGSNNQECWKIALIGPTFHGLGGN